MVPDRGPDSVAAKTVSFCERSVGHVANESLIINRLVQFASLCSFQESFFITKAPLLKKKEPATRCSSDLGRL